MKMAKLLGHKDSFLDIGSVFDGWAGMPSRDYNKRPVYYQVGREQGWLNNTEGLHGACRL